MKICILGSCSGTEPQAARHHTSWILQYRDDIYWFDAGENCSYTAHLAGFDLRSSRAVFLSHPHIDHVGGLPNMLCTIGKIRAINNQPQQFDLPIYTASPSQIKAIFEMLKETEFPFVSPIFRLHEGVVWDSGIKVEAKGNNHVAPDADNNARSFSFRISVENRSIVYSGDVCTIEDLGDWIHKCDLMMMETGHHDPLEICRYLVDNNADIQRLVFVHHGRKMLAGSEEIIAQCRRIAPFQVDAAYDNMTIEMLHG